MRMLSIVHWHHFAYMIISLALLGYGASGTFIAIFSSWLKQRFQIAFAVSALLFSVAMLVCFVLGQRVPFNALELVWGGWQFAYLSILYLLFFVPFFFAACCIGLAFTCRREYIGRIYFFDLVGAGLGAALVIAILFLLAPQDALFMLLGLAVAASLLAGWRPGREKCLPAAQIIWLLFIALGIPENWLSLRASEYKGLNQAMQVIDAKVLNEISSPLGLLTVVESPTVPLRHAPGLSFTTPHVPPGQLAVFTDGDSISAITRFDGDLGKLAYLGDMTSALPYRLLESPQVLILGAGGGSDVLLALHEGAGHVDAVEINPQMVELVRDTHAEYAGDLYEHPRVAVHIGEARGFVAKSLRDYDLIQIGLLDSFGAAGAGVLALHESYLYTVEGLQEYLNHLAPGGILVITRWIKVPPRDGLKMFATAVAALRMTGVENPRSNMAMIRSWNTSTLLVRKQAFTAEDISAIREFAQLHSFDTVYYPGMPPKDANRFNRLDEPYLYAGATAMLDEEGGEFFDRYKFYVEPATDNRPYFFHFFKWDSMREVLALRKSGGAGLIEWGYLILVGTVVQSVVAGLVLILLPLTRIRRTWQAGTASRMGAYFFLLGIAFLFIEMAFIQKFILFLSHPLYSVAVVLSGFLVFAGLGSAYSGRLTGPAAVAGAVALIAGLTVTYLFLLPLIFQQFMGSGDFAKILLSLALIAPLAFCMGMPFPLGLSRLAETAPDFIPWAWGINGFASVLSAALATLLAIHFGFMIVMFAALLLYTSAAAIMVRL